MSHEALELTSGRAPKILTDPPEEKIGRQHINLLLRLTAMYVIRFGQAVSLVDYCGPLPDHRAVEAAGWTGIAVRDGALSVYHFGVALVALKSGFETTPELRKNVDKTMLKYAVARFDRHFPDAKFLRHAVAHLADNLYSPKIMDLMRQPGSPLYWERMVGGWLSMTVRDTIPAPYKGRVASLHVDANSLAKLESIRDQAFSAFEGASPTWIDV